MTHDGVTATIDLSLIQANYRLLQSLAPKSEMTAVVKANGYGLGMIEVSKTLAEAGCPRFYTALYAEAVALRAALPSAAITPMHGIAPGEEAEALRLNITPSLHDLASLERMRKFAKAQNKTISVTLHVDTGMNRLGFGASEWEKLKNDLSLLEGIKVDTVMSHFACSDEPNNPMNEQQRGRLNEAAKLFPAAKKSLANSHGIFLGPNYHFDQCRPGRALWGTNVPQAQTQPRQVVRITAPLLQVRRVDSDGTVGYGATHPAKKGAVFATLSAGYADGILRSLSNPPAASRFYIGKHAAPIVGRVSMDLIVIDVSNIPENLVHPGAEIEISGPQQSMDELATAAGTIGYELLTHIAARVERKYIKSAA
jgi:alanine racemase